MEIIECVCFYLGFLICSISGSICLEKFSNQKIGERSFSYIHVGIWLGVLAVYFLVIMLYQ